MGENSGLWRQNFPKLKGFAKTRFAMFNNEIMMESMMKQIIQQENIVFDDGLVTEAPPSVLCGKLQGGNTQNTEDRQEERSDLRDW